MKILALYGLVFVELDLLVYIVLLSLEGLLLFLLEREHSFDDVLIEHADLHRQIQKARLEVCLIAD